MSEDEGLLRATDWVSRLPVVRDTEHGNYYRRQPVSATFFGGQQRSFGRAFISTPPPPALDEPIMRFRLWCAEAKPGETYIYHLGFLLVDREEGDSVFLDALARTVWKYHLDSRVLLTQRRLGEASYEYRATKIGEAQCLTRTPSRSSLRCLPIPTLMS